MNARSIAFRLAVSFCLLAAVLLAVGWQGVSHLRQLNAQIQHLVDDQWKKVQLAHEAYHLSDETVPSPCWPFCWIILTM